MFAGASVMHTTGISLMIEPRRTAVLRAIEMAGDLNVLFSFDATFATDRSHESEADLKAMRSADILKLNFYELAYWLAALNGEKLGSCDVIGSSGGAVKTDIVRAARKIAGEFQPALLAVTLGEYGCLLINDGGSKFCPALKVETVAAIGAGDGFIAGLLHGLTKRYANLSADDLRAIGCDELLDIGMFANAVGALVTTTAGASDGLPHTAAVNALLSQQITDIRT